MKNEPVAWMDDFGNVFEMKNQFFHIPLYTHPAKTDRYIADLKNLVDAQGQDGTWNSDKYMLGLFNGLELALSIFESREPKFKELPAKTLTDEEITQIVSEKLETWNTKEALIDFARAILRKAQEK